MTKCSLNLALAILPVSLQLFACQAAEPEQTVTKPSGKFDTSLEQRLCREVGLANDCDICAVAGWYSDTECDTFCQQPDPICFGSDAGPAIPDGSRSPLDASEADAEILTQQRYGTRFRVTHAASTDAASALYQLTSNASVLASGGECLVSRMVTNLEKVSAAESVSLVEAEVSGEDCLAAERYSSTGLSREPGVLRVEDLGALEAKAEPDYWSSIDLTLGLASSDHSLEQIFDFAAIVSGDCELDPQLIAFTLPAAGESRAVLSVFLYGARGACTTAMQSLGQKSQQLGEVRSAQVAPIVP